MKALSFLTDSTARIGILLIALCAILYIPLAGNYGMWDPWETHYGEVARQMLERNDFISQWWPGSPQDRSEFWSKSVLTFWLMAIGMKLFGVQWNPAAAGEVANSWRVEWGSRMPFIILSIVSVWFTFELVRRIAGRRAGALAGVILATSCQWALITRQAMTDMAFVGPMTIALALAGLGLILPDEMEADLPRRETQIGRWKVSWPHAPAFYGFVALMLLTVLTQLIVISAQLQLTVHLGSTVVRFSGLVPMLPYIIGFGVALWWCARATNRRQIFLFIGYVLCGHATLGKGPAGVAFPALILAGFLLISGRWKEIWTRLEIPRGLLLFAVTAMPWYHAMLIRHGMGFWNEFIGDNYVHRASGRHGDRGIFDYYLQYIGYGMFPWSGLVALGGIFSVNKLRNFAKAATPKQQLIAFAFLWALVEFTILSLVNTKFHHYILPALPAFSILAALFIEDLLESPPRGALLALGLIAIPITFLSGRDLSLFPPRVLWLFNYDYVNAPGTGRPWPLASLYGNRYEYQTQILAFAVFSAVTLALFAYVLKRAPKSAAPTEGAAPPAVPRSAWGIPALLFVALMVAGILSGPKAPSGLAPTITTWAWLIPAGLMLPVAFVFSHALFSGVSPWVRTAGWVLCAFAVVWNAFVIDKLLVELSPHWSQKHVIAAYYKERKGPQEPLIAFSLYWRGENFYTANEIYKSPNPAERTVFLGDRFTEKFQKYIADHKGRRVFFIVERARYESLRGALPEASRGTLQIVDQSNNKLYLAKAEI